MPQPPGTGAAEPQIAPLVVRNVSEFRALISTLKDGQVSIQEDGQVPASKDDLAIASSHLARFKLWAMSLGAHRPSGGRSLEYRLRDASLIRNHVISLLQDLERAIGDGTSAAKGANLQDDPSSESIQDELADYFQESGSEIDQILNEIGHVVDCLLRLSITISNPTPHDQFKSRVGVGTVETFKYWYTNHVLEKFDRIDTKMAGRLGNAMARRRQYFQYREDHSNRLAEGLDGDDLGHDLQDTTIASSIPKHLKEPRELAMKEFAGLDDNRSEISRTSYAPSVANSEQIRVPPLPKQHVDGPFKCPFCHMIVSIETRYDWKKHVFRDLRPYVCLSETCQTPDQQFSRRGDWSSHMTHEHWITWQCSFGCPGDFGSAEDFRKHTKANHAQEVPRDKMDVLESLSTKPEPSRAETTCPLCLTFRITSAQQYGSHVGAHLEQLALFTLPRQEYDEADDEAGERTDEDGSKEVQNESKKMVGSHENEQGEGERVTGENHEIDTEPPHVSSRPEYVESLPFEYGSQKNNPNEPHLAPNVDTTLDSKDRLTPTDGHSADLNEINLNQFDEMLSFPMLPEDMLSQPPVPPPPHLPSHLDDSRKGENPTQEANNHPSSRPFSDRSTWNDRSLPMDPDDDWFTYTTAADLVRYDLDHAQSPRRLERESSSSRRRSPIVERRPFHLFVGTDSSREEDSSKTNAGRSSIDTRGEPAGDYTSLESGDINIIPSSTRLPLTPTRVAGTSPYAARRIPSGGPEATQAHDTTQNTPSHVSPDLGSATNPPSVMDMTTQGNHPSPDPSYRHHTRSGSGNLIMAPTPDTQVPFNSSSANIGTENLQSDWEVPMWDSTGRGASFHGSSVDVRTESSRNDGEERKQGSKIYFQRADIGPDEETASDLGAAERTVSIVPGSKNDSVGDTESQHPGPDDGEANVSSSEEGKQTGTASTIQEKKYTKLPKSILKAPKVSFPEDPNPIREGVAPHKSDKRKTDEVPPGARWTKISRKIVNSEALTIGKERFEVRDDFVIVLRALSREEIQAYAYATQVLRERRRLEEDNDGVKAQDRGMSYHRRDGRHRREDDEDEAENEEGRLSQDGGSGTKPRLHRGFFV
ncbi:hypothetical protein G7Z17_g6850 [Cylindrodendrum hubeiense]|uniref:C2H2-type domain-containing protein n=1 Tax=Cylindrodendrum hubeiense TaxID=595255 RepID=A0A9P5H9F3_9HYPO|nr:hypothetical protein G7Z17_g6850 [Cylindrodendrum hubeiense]